MSNLNKYLPKEYKNRLKKTTITEIIKIIEKSQLPMNTVFCWAVEHNNEALMEKIYNINVLLEDAIRSLKFGCLIYSRLKEFTPWEKMLIKEVESEKS